MKKGQRMTELARLLAEVVRCYRTGKPLPTSADGVKMAPIWTVRRFDSAKDRIRGLARMCEDPKTGLLLPAESSVQSNLALNEGLTALQNLLIGAAEDAFSNAVAYLGVGDDNTAASASQTGLQAASNKLYKAMETSYPSISGQATTWRSVFETAEANFAWAEFTLASGNSDAADNLNRKVSDQGTKASGEWTLDLEITFS